MINRVTRRKLLATTGSGIVAASMPAGISGAGAQTADAWPTKPIRVIMPFGAGGSMDVLSRLLAPIVSEQLGQQVLLGYQHLGLYQTNWSY